MNPRKLNAAMKLFFSDTQLAHQPKQYMVHGRIVDPFENPNRATTLIESLQAVGLERAEPRDFGRAPILKVHADHYVAFLEEAYARFMELPNHGPEVLPNVHPYRGASLAYADRGPPRVTGIIGRAGWYMGDLSCATMEGTFRAAYASAQTAIAGAEEVLAGAASAFSLCRPPGHHAYADRCSGFCYLNNAAIAAEVLRRKFAARRHRRFRHPPRRRHAGDLLCPRRRALRLRAHRPVRLLSAFRRLRRRDRHRGGRGRQPQSAAGRGARTMPPSSPPMPGFARP